MSGFRRLADDVIEGPDGTYFRIEGESYNGRPIYRDANGDGYSFGPEGRRLEIPHNRLVFNDIHAFNRAANNPQPNMEYEFGTYRWRTDDQGRVTSAEGRVDLQDHGRVTTDACSTTTIGCGPDALESDVGFHLIGNQFNGPINRLNVVPGNGVRIDDTASNLNQGAYGSWETALRDRVRANPDRIYEMRVEASYNPLSIKFEVRQ